MTTNSKSISKGRKVSAARGGNLPSNALSADTPATTASVAPKTKTRAVKSAAVENATATPEANPTPKFKRWRIERLADIAQIAKTDPWQMDKALYFLNHAIRKCRIMNRTLLAMTYHEQGRIKLEMMDNVTGEHILEPKEEPVAEIVDNDPLGLGLGIEDDDIDPLS